MNKEMYNVLVFGMSSNSGGIETFLISNYKKIDSTKIHFDFLCNSYQKIAYEDEIKRAGSKIFKVAMRSKHPFRYRRELNSFFKENAQNYDCIWVNVNSLANIDYLKLAKKYGIKRRIIHSHNSKNMDGKLRGYLHAYNKKRIQKYATDFWACSTVAAEWMYPTSVKYQIIRNAINIQNTHFDKDKRESIRKKMNLSDAFVIGHVGRLDFQKNQKFILKLFPKIKRQIPNAKVIFVGVGEDKEELLSTIKELNLQHDVFLVGAQTDMTAWYSAFDMLLFPSLFEGLSVALLEAQANGLPILASDRVSPKEIEVNNNINFLSLSASENRWVDEIKNIFVKNIRIDENTIQSNFKEKRYDINFESKCLENKLLEDKE